MAKPEKKYWLDDARNVTKVFRAVVTVCVGLLLVDPLVRLACKLFSLPCESVLHPHRFFAFEGWFGFYGFYGLLGSLFLVLTAKELRKVVMRPEDYYERHDDDA